MSQYLINAIDLPSGTLPTTPVVIKDNDLAGKFNIDDYKYDLGIPELTYIYIDGNTNNITSTEVIQFVENGYYPIIKVTSDSPSSKGVKSISVDHPSNKLYPGIWGFCYYFYKDNNPYAMFTCLQEFQEETGRSTKVASLKTTIEIPHKNDYLGTVIGYLVNRDGRWLTTIDLFYGNTSGGGGIT